MKKILITSLLSCLFLNASINIEIVDPNNNLISDKFESKFKSKFVQGNNKIAYKVKEEFEKLELEKNNKIKIDCSVDSNGKLRYKIIKYMNHGKNDFLVINKMEEIKKINFIKEIEKYQKIKDNEYKEYYFVIIVDI